MAIPIYERQAGLNNLPSARVENAAGTEAFGVGIGRSMQGFAAGLQAKAEEFEDAQTLEAFNAFKRDVNKYHLDPDKGVYNTKLGKDAEGVFDTADVYMDNLAFEYAGRMKSPRMTQNFMRMASQVREQQGEQNMRYQAKQMDAYRDAEASAAIELAMNDIGLNYGDDAAVEGIKLRALPAIELKLRGAGDEARAAALQEFDDKVSAARVQHMLKEDPFMARDWLDRNQDSVSASLRLKLRDAIDGEVDKKVARQVVDDLWGRFGSDEEGARAAIYGSGLKDEVKDAAWGRYQARSADNNRFESQREKSWYDDWYEAIGRAGSFEDALDMVDQSGATGSKRLDLLGIAARTYPGKDKQEDDLGAYLEAYEAIARGEITDPSELVKQYGGALTPDTIKNLSKQVIDGSIRDELASEGGEPFINDVMKEAKIKDPLAQSRFLKVYTNEVMVEQKARGRKLTRVEKTMIAKGLAKTVVLGKKDGWLWNGNVKGSRYEQEQMNQIGAVWDPKIGKYVLRDDEGRVTDIIERKEEEDFDFHGKAYTPPRVDGGLYRSKIEDKREKKKWDNLPPGSPIKKVASSKMSVNQRAFVAEVVPAALKVSGKSGILPSIVVAQAIHETGWGKSRIGNNLFGIKAGNGWNGKVRSVGTHEYVNGNKVSTKAVFRDYDSMEDSVEDHGRLLSNARYKRVVSAENYKDAARALASSGYATDPKYAEKIINIIEKFGLDELDKA